MDELAASSMPRTALIIDDSRCARILAARLLQKLGFETFEAGDGLQGLDMLRQRRYSVCVCDIDMPVMDGVECVRHLREWECGHRPGWRQAVVCVSSRVDARRNQLLKEGMDHAVQKPLTATALKQLPFEHWQASSQLLQPCNHNIACR